MFGEHLRERFAPAATTLARRAALALACLAAGVILAACAAMEAPVPGTTGDPARSATPAHAQWVSPLPAATTVADAVPSAPETPSPTHTRAAPLPPAATPTATQLPTASPTPTPPDALEPDLPVAPRVGARAPEILLSDLEGEQMSINGLKGKMVLLNFWTTW